MSQLKNMKVMTTAAMLCAVAIVLGFFKLPISNVIEIRFAGLPIAIAGYLFGPVVGGLVGGIADIGGYLIRPTGPYAPGFTIDTILTGVIFGYFLYKKEVSLKRIIAASLVNKIIVNILLNSFWLAVLYHLPFTATVISRLPKEAIMLPIHVIILLVIMKPISNLSIAKISAAK